MAAPSIPPSYKQYGVKPVCYGCGRKLTYNESLWFVGGDSPAVFGFSCCPRLAAAHGTKTGTNSREWGPEYVMGATGLEPVTPSLSNGSQETVDAENTHASIGDNPADIETPTP